MTPAVQTCTPRGWQSYYAVLREGWPGWDSVSVHRLKHDGNARFAKGQYAKAESLYSQAIALLPARRLAARCAPRPGARRRNAHTGCMRPPLARRIGLLAPPPALWLEVRYGDGCKSGYSSPGGNRVAVL